MVFCNCSDDIIIFFREKNYVIWDFCNPLFKLNKQYYESSAEVETEDGLMLKSQSYMTNALKF